MSWLPQKVERVPVGFWAQTVEEARALNSAWPGDYVHLFWNEEERQRVGAYLAGAPSIAAYRGISRCRLCGKMNGSHDFGDERYVWPQGFAHYVLDHAVKPPEEFIAWVNARAPGGAP